MFGNRLKTSLLMAAIVALFGTVGAVLGGAQGMLVALVLGGAMNLWAYWFSDRMVLRMYNAQEVDETSAPGLYRMVRELAEKAQIPMPRVYLIDEDQPNAFATGRNPENAAVAATTGIMRILSERELRGVMAHELAHVKHRDILISTISATMAGAISSLAQLGLFFGGRDGEGRPGNPVVSIIVMFVAPLAAMLIQFAISRAREFDADRGGAQISGDPQALASALDKIHRYARGIPMATAEAHPATAQMMIMNPLSGGGMAGLFSTHPDTGERIARLTAMANVVSTY
ncbi:MAG: zinc metalloprotease HtpX [Lysobacter sp.]|nr:zinc metalloprotease HtpX [Lysobacter sp.]